MDCPLSLLSVFLGAPNERYSALLSIPPAVMVRAELRGLIDLQEKFYLGIELIQESMLSFLDGDEEPQVTQ